MLEYVRGNTSRIAKTPGGVETAKYPLRQDGHSWSELPRHSEWRAWYRQKALGWLLARNYYFEGVDKCLDQLEADPAKREAGVGLFWDAYLADGEPLKLTEVQTGRVAAMLWQRGNEASGENREHQALVKLHLVGTLAVSLIRPDIEIGETPIASMALDRAEEVMPEVGGFNYAGHDWNQGFKLLDDDCDLFSLSLRLVGAIIALELGLRRYAEKRPDKALALIARGYRLGEGMRFCTYDPPPDQEPEESPLKHRFFLRVPPGFQSFDYLPHSWGGFDDDFTFRVFEEIKSHPELVEDWDPVIRMCNSLAEEDWTEGDRRDYWIMAAAFAEHQMSTPEWRSEDALRRDLEDVWEEMVPEAKRHLAKAEAEWLRGPEPEYSFIMDAYCLALEDILSSIYPLLDAKAKDPMDDRSPSLRIGRMAERLERDSEVQSEIRLHLKDSRDSGFVLKRLPWFLKFVASTRNDFRHLKDRKKIVRIDKAIENAKTVQRELLGRGNDQSVLRRLVETQRVVMGRPTR